MRYLNFYFLWDRFVALIKKHYPEVKTVFQVAYIVVKGGATVDSTFVLTVVATPYFDNLAHLSKTMKNEALSERNVLFTERAAQ
jgi:hypothetical protein